MRDEVSRSHSQDSTLIADDVGPKEDDRFLSSSPSSSNSVSDHYLPHDDYRNSESLSTPSLMRAARQPSILDEDEQPTAAAAATASLADESKSKRQDTPVTWMSLPHKGQLAVLTLARLSEPLAERSLAAYMFYQLRSFDPSLPDSTIASQGGMLTAAFAAAQFVTAVWWGRAADTPWIGRKRVLLVGLFGTALASIGVGFSKSYYQALCFRAMAGALNGNIGVMRTMISEIIKEKRFQSRAFLLLPMCFNIGIIIGPILGGFLADPIASFPDVFGPGSVIGGKDGVSWMIRFPYALPNLFSGLFIIFSALGIILGLDETHRALRNKPDYGRQLGRWLFRCIMRRDRDSEYAYTQLETSDETELQQTPTTPKFDIERADQSDESVRESNLKAATEKRSPFRAILLKNVILTLLTHFVLAFHVSTFNSLIFLLLPVPRASSPSHFTLSFTGGLGLTTEKVGLATAIIGLIGFPLQIFFYPPINTKLGTLKSYRVFLPFSAIAYTFLPFLTILPNKAWLVWSCLTLVLAAQVLSRTFALTGGVILINNSSPSPEVLGTIHGVAQSVSSAARMLGPTIGGWLLGIGLRNNCVGAVWWTMTTLVMINWSLLWCIFEGDGRGGRA